VLNLPCLFFKVKDYFICANLSFIAYSATVFFSCFLRLGGVISDREHNQKERKMNKLPPELIKKLNLPLPKEAVSQHPTRTYLSAIKAIYVVERLNDVFGIGGWYIKHDIIEADTMIVVKGIFTVPEHGIEIEQFGGNDNADRGDAYKGACTDALTKIGSYLGIGMDVFKGLSEHSTTPQREPVAEKPMTEKQRALIRRLLESTVLTDDEVTQGQAWLEKEHSSKKASEFIDKLNGMIEVPF